jgi:Sister chromatid cohesion protein Dcc1
MSATNPALISLKFIPEFTEAKYELFEVDNEILEQIQTQKEFSMCIKSYQNPVKQWEIGQSGNEELKKTAALSTKDATYRLKKSETSNTMLFAGL